MFASEAIWPGATKRQDLSEVKACGHGDCVDAIAMFAEPVAGTYFPAVFAVASLAFPFGGRSPAFLACQNDFAAGASGLRGRPGHLP
jgi:hypothetical protein